MYNNPHKDLSYTFFQSRVLAYASTLLTFFVNLRDLYGAAYAAPYKLENDFNGKSL